MTQLVIPQTGTVWGSPQKKVGRGGWIGGLRPRGWALGRMGGPRPRGWAPTPFISMQGLHVPFSAPDSDGWAAATGLGSRWAPFMSFLGSWVGGWAAATGLGSMFLSRVLSRMGGPRPRGWACAGLPSCSFLGLGRVGRGHGAGL